MPNLLLEYTLIFACSLSAQERLDNWKLVQTVPLEGIQHHVQGIDTDGKLLWVTSVDAKAGKGYLTQYEVATGRMLKRVEVQEEKRIHPGGISLDGESLWIPVAEYDRDGPSTIQRRNATTLELEGRFDVNDHIGCVAAAKAWLVGANWDARKVYHWSRDGAQLVSMANPRPLAWQDIKVVDGRVVASGAEGRNAGAIEWLDMDTLTLLRRVQAGKTDRGVRFTNEGMAVDDGRLYLVPEDGESRLFIFRIE
jgi:hypothetical protein